MSDLDDMIIAGREVIGAPYRFWGGGPLEDCEPMYVDCPGIGADYVIENGVNCSGLLNYMRADAGYDPIGGTLAYGNVIEPWEYFDPSKWYPVGSVPVQRFITGVSEGHTGIVSRPNQLFLQSRVGDGCMEWLTVAEQNEFTAFDWIGWIPDHPAADWLPGWGEGGVEGYPGDAATPEDTAAWMARVAERIYGVPGILPVMTSCVELTSAWTSLGDVKHVPGYLWPVDGYSVGWFQQQYDDNPEGIVFGWGMRAQLINAEYALAKFLDAALAVMPDPVPTDPEGLGEWCQEVQRSGFPERYARKGYPMAVRLLGAPPEPSVPDWRRYGWIELHSPGGATVNEGDGSRVGPDWRRYGWVELHGPGGATVYDGEG